MMMRTLIIQLLLAILWSKISAEICNESEILREFNPRPVYKIRNTVDVKLYYCFITHDVPKSQNMTSAMQLRNINLITNRCLDFYLQERQEQEEEEISYRETASVSHQNGSISNIYTVSGLNKPIMISVGEVDSIADLSADKVLLENGDECRYTNGYCSFSSNSIIVVWNSLMDPCSRLVRLPYDWVGEYETKTSPKYFVLSKKTDPQRYALRLGAPRKLSCGDVWETQKPGIVVSEDELDTDGEVLQDDEESVVRFEKLETISSYVKKRCEFIKRPKRYDGSTKLSNTQQYNGNSEIDPSLLFFLTLCCCLGLFFFIFNTIVSLCTLRRAFRQETCCKLFWCSISQGWTTRRLYLNQHRCGILEEGPKGDEDGKRVQLAERHSYMSVENYDDNYDKAGYLQPSFKVLGNEVYSYAYSKNIVRKIEPTM